ncbi:MAG: aminomethyltransferase family protein, partial [Pseudomonadota bacterium]
VYGHERPRWFAPEGVEPVDIYGFNRSPKLHDIVAAECRAVEERAGIMDISAFSKIEVSGPGAAAFLDPLLPNRLPKPGRIALTHLLTESGRIELETTVVALAEDRFYLVCAAFFEQRLLDLLTFAPASETVTITNRSRDWGALALNGPLAREILAACTPDRLDNAAFKWLTAQEITVARHRLWAFRMSYAGELGWEFHGPQEAIQTAYRALKATGKPRGLANYGSFAMNAMRMEKAFKGAGELTNEVTLPEADVMRFVKLDKDFRGKPATEAATPRWKCVYLEVEDNGLADGNGGEAVLADGTQIGTVSSIAFGHRTRKLLAFAYVKPEHAAPGTTLDVVIMGDPRPATVLADAAYDPESALPRTDAPEMAAE